MDRCHPSQHRPPPLSPGARWHAPRPLGRVPASRHQQASPGRDEGGERPRERTAAPRADPQNAAGSWGGGRSGGQRYTNIPASAAARRKAGTHPDSAPDTAGAVPDGVTQREYRSRQWLSVGLACSRTSVSAPDGARARTELSPEPVGARGLSSLISSALALLGRVIAWAAQEFLPAWLVGSSAPHTHGSSRWAHSAELVRLGCSRLPDRLAGDGIVLGFVAATALHSPPQSHPPPLGLRHPR